jgi:hypothetical protein
VRAARLDPCRSGPQQLDDPGLEPLAPTALDAHPHPLAGQGLAHRHGEAAQFPPRPQSQLEGGQTATVAVESRDLQLEQLAPTWDPGCSWGIGHPDQPTNSGRGGKRGPIARSRG